MKKVVSIGLVMLLALAMSSGAPQSQTRVAVAQPLLDRTAAGDEVSVIVGVATRFVPEGNLAADAAADQRVSMAQALDDTMARAAAVGVQVGRRFDTIPYFTARVNRAQLEALATTSGVASITEDARTTPSLNISTGLINAPPAWAAGHTGAGWSVAVLDSGVDKTHTFLGGKVVSEACYSDANGLGSGNSTTVCPGGVFQSTAIGSGVNCSASVEGCDHGTHVAGIAAGANGPSGANGVAPGASIVAIQVFTRFDGAGASGCGSSAGPCISAFNSDIIRGLERVLALKNAGGPLSQIAAVNMSLGSAPQGDAGCDAANAPTKAAIDNLLSVGIPSVIASGNNAVGGAISAPACISTAVAVGATTKGVCPGSPLCPGGAPAGLPNVPDFSNHSAAVELLAPGVDINSSVPGGGFSQFDGTSMATPHVAGAWAVLKQAAPGATPAQVLLALASTGTSITEPFTGIPKPLINVNNARLALLGPTPGAAPGAPTSFAATVSGNAVNMSWGAPASGGAPTGYTLVARTVPGGPVALTLPLGNVNAFGVTAPNGVFYLTVVATNASGPGPESNSVTITVPSVGPPPGAPTGLTVSVTGNTAVFNFAAPASGGPVTNFVLLGGLTPGFAAPVASLPLGPTQTAVAIPGVPPGTWFARVVSQNAAGVSLPTNEVSFTIAGPMPPGAPTLNPAVVAGNTVSLSWAAGAGGAPTSYTLFAAATPGGAPFLSAPLGGNAIAFGGVPGGTYYVRMVAHNALGTSLPSNEIMIVVP